MFINYRNYVCRDVTRLSATQTTYYRGYTSHYCFIWLLLFLLGIDVGSNQEIINGLHTIGLEAVILTLAAVLGSVTAAWALWYMVYKRNRRSEA